MFSFKLLRLPILYRLFLLAIMFPATGMASDRWKTLYSYAKDITKLQLGQDVIYGITDGKVFAYDINDEVFSTYPHLHNDKVVDICYSEAGKCLVLAFEDATVQLVYQNGDMATVAGIKNSIWNIDKTIVSISASGEKAFVATNFGLSVVDVKKAEITASVILNERVNSAAELEGKIYIATASGVKMADAAANIQDKTVWTLLPIQSAFANAPTTFADTEITVLKVFKGQLHFLVKNKFVGRMDAGGTFKTSLVDSPLYYMDTFDDNNKMLIYRDNVLYPFTDIDTYTRHHTQLGTMQAAVWQGTNNVWIGTYGNQLSHVQFTNGESATQTVKSKLHENGPLTNYPFAMQYHKGKLHIVGGGYFYDRYAYDAAYSVFDGISWKNSSLEQIRTINATAKDFTALAIHPEDENKVYISSWGEGLYEFNGTECVKNYTSDNSSLQDIFGKTSYVRIAALAFDASNNLWMSNQLVDKPIKALLPDGQWRGYSLAEVADTRKTVSNILIDRYGTKWITTSIHNGTLLLWNDNGTLDNTADDQKQYISTFTDQDGANISTEAIHAVKEDKDGYVWLATKVGPFRISNTANVVNNNLVINKIKIPRNDGTNLADILLEGVHLNAMAIDGANQKWFGSENSGVYLISADNQTMRYHFTTENSILPSNRIISLAVDEETGEVFIGTDKGIVSFRSEYVSGRTDYSDVKVYPNPVRPDYYGNIVIQGLMADSEVRITDLNRNIIHKGTSLGGTYVWDGKDIRGVRVKTGIYLIFATTDDGADGVVAKVAVVSE